MSRQGSRIQRWLRGDTESTDGSLGDTPAGVTPPEVLTPRATPQSDRPNDEVPLPVRTPDPRRPQVQGLSETTLSMRRRQVVGQARHRAAPPEPPATLVLLHEDLSSLLERALDEVEGLEHAVIALPDGALVASVGLDVTQARNLAEMTGHIPDNLGVPAEAVEKMTLTLATGDTVVCAGAGTASQPAILRVTLRDVSLGIAILQTQQTARRVRAVLERSA